ncbi:MAG TPA: phytanoyl-CoA dioxygenase family protein [Allosphingosinicella sp.]|jgi:hypothetical protein
MKIWPIIRAAYNAARDKRYRDYYLQRRVQNIAAREKRAERLVRRLPPADLIAGDEAAALASDGYVPLPDLLSADEVRAMRDHFAAHLCSDPYRPHLGNFPAPAGAPGETHVAVFSNEAVAAAPFAFKAANDPRVLAALGHVFGAKPTIGYIAAWWSLPGHEAPEHAEFFHRDYDDYRSAKLFLYLTDVDHLSGPHSFVPGSHKREMLVERSFGRRYSEQEVSAHYPAQDMLVLTGPAGTALLESTFGLHRATPPLSKPRLLFQVLYTLRPNLGGPRRPLRASQSIQDGVPLDPWVNRSFLT